MFQSDTAAVSILALLARAPVPDAQASGVPPLNLTNLATNSDGEDIAPVVADFAQVLTDLEGAIDVPQVDERATDAPDLPESAPEHEQPVTVSFDDGPDQIVAEKLIEPKTTPPNERPLVAAITSPQLVAPPLPTAGPQLVSAPVVGPHQGNPVDAHQISTTVIGRSTTPRAAQPLVPVHVPTDALRSPLPELTAPNGPQAAKPIQAVATAPPVGVPVVGISTADPIKPQKPAAPIPVAAANAPTERVVNPAPRAIAQVDVSHTQNGPSLVVPPKISQTPARDPSTPVAKGDDVAVIAKGASNTTLPNTTPPSRTLPTAAVTAVPIATAQPEATKIDQIGRPPTPETPPRVTASAPGQPEKRATIATTNRPQPPTVGPSRTPQNPPLRDPLQQHPIAVPDPKSSPKPAPAKPQPAAQPEASLPTQSVPKRPDLTPIKPRPASSPIIHKAGLELQPRAVTPDPVIPKSDDPKPIPRADDRLARDFKSGPRIGALPDTSHPLDVRPTKGDVVVASKQDRPAPIPVQPASLVPKPKAPHPAATAIPAAPTLERSLGYMAAQTGTAPVLQYVARDKADGSVRRALDAKPEASKSDMSKDMSQAPRPLRAARGTYPADPLKTPNPLNQNSGPAVFVPLPTSSDPVALAPLGDDVADLPVFTAPGQSTVPSSAAAPALPSGPAPKVAAQIVAAVLQSPSGTTEIALNPKELGRVRIALTPAEAGLSVTILAERPETADLMRRNIDVLAREFLDMGHENLTFSFSDHSDGADQNSQDSPNPAPLRDDVHPIETPIPATTLTLNGGLDLKL